MDAATALLVGEGELDRVERMLDRIEVPYERIRRPRPFDRVPAPTRLLVVSGACLSKLPRLEAEEGNQHRRVCIHNQDFLPLRERLRERGFHYLVQSALDETSLAVFLRQLLHESSPHRASPRLPLGGPVEVHGPGWIREAKLGDLSARSCRVLGVDGLGVGDAATVVLPGALGGGRPLPLPGTVIRAAADEAVGESQGYTAVIRFSVLDEDASERLGRLVRGELIGARVSPLAASPPETMGAAAAPTAAPAAPAEGPKQADADDPRDRRREVRHPFRGRVEMMELPGDAEGALGRDLSLDGICIQGTFQLKPGMKVTLALYGGNQSAPVVVEAEAIRVTPTEAALVFGRLSNDQQDRLAMLIAERPAVETLDPATASRVLPTRILRRNG